MFGQKTSNYSKTDLNTLNFVNINKVDLYYYIALPFIGTFDQIKNIYLLGQNNLEKYLFPFKVGVIETIEFPELITIYINKNVAKVGMPLKKGDEIYFKKNTSSVKFTNVLYGEIIIKCPVEVESSHT